MDETLSKTTSVADAASAVAPTFEEIYHAYVEFVWRVVRRRGVPEHEVEELVHEAFLVVHRRLPFYEPRASIRSWVFAIARGVVSNHRRGRRRASEREMNFVQSDSPETPEEAYRRKQLAHDVALFIETLDDKKKSVFMLCDVEGLRAASVAARLGIRTNLVHTRLRSARVSFKIFLAERGYGDEGQ